MALSLPLRPYARADWRCNCQSLYSREAVIYRAKINSETRAKLIALQADAAKRAVAFDTAFNHNDPSKFYCTELVTELYRQAGHPVVSDSVLQKRAIFPGHLANSDRLKQIGTTRGEGKLR